MSTGLSLLVSNPTASRQGIPAVTSPWDATPFTCPHSREILHISCDALQLIWAQLISRGKNISLLTFCLFTWWLTNLPTAQTAKIMLQRQYTLGNTPVQFLCVTAAPQSLKPGLHIAGSPRSTNFIGIRPRHVIRLLLIEPERRMRGQRQSCSGHVPGTGVQTIPDLAGAEHSDTWAGIKSASKKLTCQKLLELTWAGRVNEYQVSASHHVATPFWSQ